MKLNFIVQYKKGTVIDEKKHERKLNQPTAKKRTDADRDSLEAKHQFKAISIVRSWNF